MARRLKKFYPPANLLYSKPRVCKFMNYEGSTSNVALRFGDYGVIMTNKALINPKSIYSFLFLMARHLKGFGEVRLRALLSRAQTAKSVGLRMGKGKGAIARWVYRVKAGTVLFEFCTSKSLEDTTILFNSVRQRFPFKIILVATDAAKKNLDSELVRL